MLPGLSPEDDHRRVRARLETDGWKWLARGDWSQVYASPDGQQVARVVAFDPAYALHVRTCLANPGAPASRTSSVSTGTAIWRPRARSS